MDGDNPKSDWFLENAQLTSLPFPARHLVDVESYRYTIDGVRALSLIAQLGCPFGCGFCGGRLSPSLRRVRMRTSENIVQEMVHLYRTYGTKGFMLYDDELNVNPKMLELMEAITEAQQQLGVEFRLSGLIKAELFTEQQAAAMHRAGFRWILVGFESGHERILTNIHKQSTLADNTRCLTIAKRHGLKVKALMSLGHPGESEATVHATRDWLVDTQPDDFDATVITTYPGTPYFDEAVETAPGIWTYTFSRTGDRLHSQEVDYSQVAEYYKGIPGSYRSYVYTDHLSAEDLVRLRDWLEADARKTLGIAYPATLSALRYEHSMGQAGLPSNILRTSTALASEVYTKS
ncbi:MAG: B12-binding domain-containing radical SAM protein [Nitrospiraceae bacterium]